MKIASFVKDTGKRIGACLNLGCGAAFLAMPDPEPNLRKCDETTYRSYR